jgi:hypothetical protein
MKHLVPVALLLLLCAFAPMACTSKPVEKPPEKKNEEPPKDKVDPKMPKIG